MAGSETGGYFDSLGNFVKSAARETLEEVASCAGLVEWARELAWGRPPVAKPVDEKPVLKRDGDTITQVIYPRGKGMLDLNYDGQGVSRARRNGKPLLERLDAPNQKGECLWRVNGGNSFHGKLEVGDDGTLSFRVLNGDTYLFNADGSRAILRADGLRIGHLDGGGQSLTYPDGLKVVLDKQWRITKIDFPAGRSASLSYDAAGAPESFVDPEGKHWRRAGADAKGFDRWVGDDGEKQTFKVVFDAARGLSLQGPAGEVGSYDRSGQQLQERASPRIEISDLGKWLSTSMKRLDGNEDDVLSDEEMIKVLKTEALSAADRRMLFALLLNSEALSQLDQSDGGYGSISVSDLDKLVALAQREPDAPLTRQVETALQMAGQRQHGLDARLYGRHERQQDGIKPEAVKQGLIGDCWAMAAIAAIAASSPETIAAMIQENPDSTFTVTFPGDREHPVTVPRPSASELTMYAAGSEHGIWVAVIEKALARHYNSKAFFPSSEDIDALHGGYPDEALSLLTGGKARIFHAHSADLEEKLMVAAQWGLPIVAGSRANAWGGTEVPDERGVWSQHAYSVTYDPATRAVTVRNPWGAGIGTSHPSEPLKIDGSALDGKLDGTFKMSLDDFRRSFSFISLVAR